MTLARRPGMSRDRYAVATTTNRLIFDGRSTAIRRLRKVTETYPVSRSHADLVIYLGRSAAARS